MRPWVRSGSLATSGGGGGGGLLSRRKATKPPAIRPSIIRKISRETAGRWRTWASRAARIFGGQGSCSRSRVAGLMVLSTTLQAGPIGRQARGAGKPWRSSITGWIRRGSSPGTGS